MTKEVAVIGGGPAGLMAAECLAEAGLVVTVFEALPSLGRKFLMAGRGGLNLTHSEALPAFLSRYGAASHWLAPLLEAFPPAALTAWCEALGQETFIGSSGRIFPRSMKASPLLRAWLARLTDLGVQFRTRHRWLGWRNEALLFATPTGEITQQPGATLLALGGASWPRLGSDGAWVPLLTARGVAITALEPANCGVTVAWSDYLKSRFAGQPLKPLAIIFAGQSQRGEAVLTQEGLEGGALYGLVPLLRAAFAAAAPVKLQLDLQPTLSRSALAQRLEKIPSSASLSTRLRKVGLSAAAVALLQEPGRPSGDLVSLIKSFPLTATGLSGLTRAISTAGGIKRSALDKHLMLRALPGVFAVGEMLDWEAPTGGYLLQACFSSAVAAAAGVVDYLKR